MPTLRRAATLGFAGLLTLAIAGCGGGAAPTPAVTELSLEATEFVFTPDTISAPQGDIKVTLVNAGGVEHDFMIDELTGAHIHVNVGETNDATFAATPGTYTYYCTIPGHRQAGMEGTLTVSE
jgi:plastocyanin